jgi:hypothetical protein
MAGLSDMATVVDPKPRKFEKLQIGKKNWSKILQTDNKF